MRRLESPSFDQSEHNAAWRAGSTLHFDPATYTFPQEPEANQFLTRAEYRKPWVYPGE